jgi:hypothetical protein
MTTDSVQDLVLGYWTSWQEPADWDAFRECLDDHVSFDPGGRIITGADALVAMLRATASPWQDVSMLSQMYSVGEVAIVYEGTDRKTGVRTRVAEHIEVRGAKISKVVATIAVVG